MIDHPDECVTLWRAVIARALVDMMWDLPEGKKYIPQTHDEHARNRGNAYEWFFIPNREFYKVCELSDLDPRYVRTMARRIFDGIISMPVPNSVGSGRRAL